MQNENFEDKIKGNPIALLPVAVFLVLYLGLGITFEYVLHISMGFYNNPIVAAFVSTAMGTSVGTIAATSTQGCKMKDMFHVNFIIALPAALLAVAIITAISFATEARAVAENSYSLV